MKPKIKSGKEMLDNFFEELEEIENVDKTIAQSLKKLYQDGKFTETNISSALEELRERKDEDD